MATAAIAGEEILLARSPLLLALHAIGCLAVGVVAFILAHPLVAQLELPAADPLMQLAQRIDPEAMPPLTRGLADLTNRILMVILTLGFLPLTLPWLRGALHAMRHRQPDGNVTASLAVILAVAWTVIATIGSPRLATALIPSDPLLPSAAVAAALLFLAQAIAQIGLRRVREEPGKFDETHARQLIAARGHLPSSVPASLKRGRIAVLCTVLAAMAATGTWISRGSISSLPNGLIAAVAVLFAAAPVAFTLSASLPWVTALQSLGTRRIRLHGADVLQTLARVRRVFAGAHGAVATEESTVRSSAMIGVGQRELLRDAAAIQLPVSHPIAYAIVRRAEALRPDLPAVTNFRSHPGEGVEGRLEGRQTIAGSPALLSRLGVDTSSVAEEVRDWSESGWTPVLVASEGRLAGAIAVDRSIAEGSAEAARRLEAAGIELHLMSGGAEAACGGFARELAPASWAAPLSITERATRVSRSAERELTLAVGDREDSKWMSAAQLRAVASADETTADEDLQIVIPRDRPLASLADALDTAREAEALVRRNGRHAIIHHVLLLPLVSAVVLPLSGWNAPWWAGWIGSPIIAATAAGVATIAVVINGRITSEAGGQLHREPHHNLRRPASTKVIRG